MIDAWAALIMVGGVVVSSRLDLHTPLSLDQRMSLYSRDYSPTLRTPCLVPRTIWLPLWDVTGCTRHYKVVTVSALLAAQVFLVIAILMGEGLYMVVKVLYSSKQKHDYTS